jgi:hypothetical protein
MSKFERLGAVRNGRPVIAIDEDLLAKLEADEQVVAPKESAPETGKDKVVRVPSLEKIVTPKEGT